jgi:hypothetical protein
LDLSERKHYLDQPDLRISGMNLPFDIGVQYRFLPVPIRDGFDVPLVRRRAFSTLSLGMVW